MIIDRKTAIHLICIGKASRISVVTQDGRQYVAIDRHDKQRVDHYWMTVYDYKYFPEMKRC